MTTDHKITFQDFTERVAKRAKVSPAEAGVYIHQLSKSIGYALEGGREVSLYHFGRFHLPYVDEREAHNPSTGEALTTPAHTNVQFRPYNAVLVAVNLPFEHLRTRLLKKGESERGFDKTRWILLAILALMLVALGFGVERKVAGRDSAAELPVATAKLVRPVQAASVVPAPPAAEAAPAPTKTDKITTEIVIARGDTLWAIAASELGDATWWPTLYVENRARLSRRNPDLIHVGNRLRLPTLEGGVAQPTAADIKLKTAGYQLVAYDYAQLGNSRAAAYRTASARGFRQ